MHHGIIILNIFLITWFLWIEARRYRYYELWSYRIRLMETDYYAAMLVPPFQPSPGWAESLAENLLSPSFPISMWEAVGRRLRRNYLFIYTLLSVAWLGKSYLFPQPTAGFDEFVSRCAIGPIHGSLVLTLAAVFYGMLLLVAIGTLRMTRATGEVLPRYGAHDEREISSTAKKKTSLHGWLYPQHRRRQFLALIITSLPEKLSGRILADLKRGVTAMQGKGMYTGADRSILMCALTVTEIHSLKAVVADEDPHAFVIVSPVQEILGRGFNLLNNVD